MKHYYHGPYDFCDQLDMQYEHIDDVKARKLVNKFIDDNPQLFGDDNWHIQHVDVLNNTVDEEGKI